MALQRAKQAKHSPKASSGASTAMALDRTVWLEITKCWLHQVEKQSSLVNYRLPNPIQRNWVEKVTSMNRMQIWLAALQRPSLLDVAIQANLSKFDTANSIFGLNDEPFMMIFLPVLFSMLFPLTVYPTREQPHHIVLMRTSESSVIVCKQVLSFDIHLKATAFVWSINILYFSQVVAKLLFHWATVLSSLQ